MMRNYTIREIEKLTYTEAKNIALETMTVKDHDIIFVNLGEYFGYSVLVFKNGKHIYYANDYELHNSYKVKEFGRTGLRDFYIRSLNNKLFTVAELMEDIKTYEEYRAKTYFLRNYYIMQFDRLSIFVIGDEAKKHFNANKKNYPFWSNESFCYVKEEKIIEEQKKYMDHLNKCYETLQETEETFREMIAKELSNHEACITMDYTDALQSLGLRYEELNEQKQEIVKEELRKQIKRYEEMY